MSTPSLPPEEWDPQRALQSMVLESNFENEPDLAKITQKMVTDASPMAAQRIIQIAMFSHDERRALDASKYIVDRVLGPVTNPSGAGEEITPLEALLGDVVVDMVSSAETHANQEG